MRILELLIFLTLILFQGSTTTSIETHDDGCVYKELAGASITDTDSFTFENEDSDTLEGNLIKVAGKCHPILRVKIELPFYFVFLQNWGLILFSDSSPPVLV